MITYSIEQLHHFKCGQCRQWFSIGDCSEDVLTQPLACPNCKHLAFPSPAPLRVGTSQKDLPAAQDVRVSPREDGPLIPRTPSLLEAAIQMIMRVGRILLYCSRGTHMRTTHHDARGKHGAWTCRDCGHDHAANWMPKGAYHEQAGLVTSNEAAGPSGDLTPCG